MFNNVTISRLLKMQREEPSDDLLMEVLELVDEAKEHLKDE